MEALPADQLSPLERSRTQGTNVLLVGLGAATGSLSSGIVFAAPIPAAAYEFEISQSFTNGAWERIK